MKKNSFHTLFSNTKNDFSLPRQHVQGIYELDEETKTLVRVGEIDIQDERNKFLLDTVWKESIKINEKTGNLEINALENSNQPIYGDVSKMPRNLSEQSELLQEIANNEIDAKIKEVEIKHKQDEERLNRYEERLARKIKTKKERVKGDKNA